MGTDHALHAVAYAALRVLSPRRAHGLVVRIGSFLPQRHSLEAARDAARRLRGGTCLSRALTIAARTPISEVVIAAGRARTLNAHAWVELNGIPILDGDVTMAVIARIGRSHAM